MLEKMNAAGMTRKDFLQGALSSMGLGFLGGGVFAVPEGWAPPKKPPRLVFGVVSDTHMRTHYDGVNFYSHYDTVMGDQALKAVFTYFKRARADAVVNCGDLTDRGMTRTMELYKAAWDQVFAEDPKPVHLYATGNHDVEDGFADWVRGVARSEDPAVVDKIRLGPNLKSAMERIWGEPYDDVWHKVVKGHHFFGFGWGNTPEDWKQVYHGRLYHDSPMEGKGCSRFIHKGLWMTELVRREHEAGRLDPAKPFFLAHHCNINRYDRRGAIINTHLSKALGLKPGQFCNGLGFFGHGHRSNADWYFFWDNKASFPSLQCGSLAYWKERGGGWPRFAQGYGDGKTVEGVDNRPMAMLVRVYDGFVVLRNICVEVKPSVKVGKVGPDLALPLDGFVPSRHPAQFATLAKIVGNPEFRAGAELKVTWGAADVKVEIPRADGKNGMRAYGYNVGVVGAEGATVWKNALAKGYSYGDSFAPDGGVTTVSFKKEKLPPGKELTFRVLPSSEFGERGKPIEKTEKCIRVTLKKFAPKIDGVTKFVITKGANIPDGDRMRLVVSDAPPCVTDVLVEDGEVVVYARPMPGAGK